ncbi:hypothetical protein F5Y07DRAFT_351961 [Xylaria sp. FL0933]|nr:hypothetical protein F5Y07DRAFT_351961 [Xylaria sp. FL0933]
MPCPLASYAYATLIGKFFSLAKVVFLSYISPYYIPTLTWHLAQLKAGVEVYAAWMYHSNMYLVQMVITCNCALPYFSGRNESTGIYPVYLNFQGTTLCLFVAQSFRQSPTFE